MPPQKPPEVPVAVAASVEGRQQWHMCRSVGLPAGKLLPLLTEAAGDRRDMASRQ